MTTSTPAPATADLTTTSIDEEAPESEAPESCDESFEDDYDDGDPGWLKEQQDFAQDDLDYPDEEYSHLDNE